FPQFRFQQLASRSMGQAGYKDELIGHLPLSKLADQKRAQFLRGHLATFLQNDSRERSFLPLRVRGRDHCCLLHSRVGDKSILHVAGADPFTTGLNHMHEPSTLDVDTWRLSIRGQVYYPLSLSPADLVRMTPHTVTNTLECAGNARAFQNPHVPGVQWQRGAVGTARFHGPTDWGEPGRPLTW